MNDLTFDQKLEAIKAILNEIDIGSHDHNRLLIHLNDIKSDYDSRHRSFDPKPRKFIMLSSFRISPHIIKSLGVNEDSNDDIRYDIGFNPANSVATITKYIDEVF